MPSYPTFIAAAFLTVVALPAHAQSSLRCDSPNYQYRHCAAATPRGVQGVVVQRQISASPCIEGRSWGWDSRGVWVTGGCSAVFTVFGRGGASFVPPAPAPGAGVVRCESRNYGYSFCPSGGRVVSASVARQISSAPCLQGRSWGWSSNGIWVSDGCEADFRVRSDVPAFPPPPGPGLTVCESHEYRYNFCAAGRVRGAQLVQQRSSAPCVQGRSWGFTRDGIWVDHGCEGAFRVF